MHWIQRNMSWFLMVFVVAGISSLLALFDFFPYPLEPGHKLAMYIVTGISGVLTMAGAVSRV